MQLEETCRCLVAKVVGAVFAAVIAPILVGVGVDPIQGKIDNLPALGKPAADAVKANDTASTSRLGRSRAREDRRKDGSPSSRPPARRPASSTAGT